MKKEANDAFMNYAENRRFEREPVICPEILRCHKAIRAFVQRIYATESVPPGMPLLLDECTPISMTRETDRTAANKTLWCWVNLCNMFVCLFVQGIERRLDIAPLESCLFPQRAVPLDHERREH